VVSAWPQRAAAKDRFGLTGFEETTLPDVVLGVPCGFLCLDGGYACVFSLAVLLYRVVCGWAEERGCNGRGKGDNVVDELGIGLHRMIVD
jgi:hypothetical protein